MLKTIGFPISHKENENRRALVPDDIKKMKYPECLVFETGYGDCLGFCDEDYISNGCKVADREEVLKQDVICDPKIGDAEYLDCLSQGQTIFGWIHATQNKDITDKIVNSGLTAYAWEKMFHMGRHLFWRNNELAGEAAVMHAFQCFGKMPYGVNAAVIGRGNTARGAIKVLNMLGATVTQYDRHTEELLRSELGKYEVVVNCVLWDITRKDHIISHKDLKNMKRNSMIIDVSCDKHGAIETSVPTTIEDPTYMVDGIMHYVVDHTPTLFFKTFTFDNSSIIYKYIEQLSLNETDEVLNNALIIDNGNIADKEIIDYQNR